MKKIFILSVLLTINTSVAISATPWWERATICYIDTQKCYANMGDGYEPEMWDADAKCWGVKRICPVAMNDPSEEPELLSISAINSKISSDFNASKLNSDYSGNDSCFGARKTQNITASLNGSYVKIWCMNNKTGHGDVLDVLGREIINNAVSPSETIYCGQITNNPQPTCQELADEGFVAISQTCCYGKYFNPTEYFIDCDKGTGDLPGRLIVLNDARDYTTSPVTYPTDQSAATTLFVTMYRISQEQHQKYFDK